MEPGGSCCRIWRHLLTALSPTARPHDMIVYNVWFSFEAGSDETTEITNVRSFLENLKVVSKIHDYRILRNYDKAAKSKLPPYQVAVEFLDERQFGLPFKEVAQMGIHAGPHGAMMEHVDSFIVEVFEDL
jgi:hypothetical protein